MTVNHSPPSIDAPSVEVSSAQDSPTTKNSCEDGILEAKDIEPEDSRPHSTERRVVVQTLGCRLNMAESELIRRQMAAQGYRQVAAGEAADVVIVNTCTVTAQADAKSRQMLRAARRGHPEAIVAATGCFAQLHPEAALGAGGADLVVGNGEKLSLPHHVQNILREGASANAPRIVMPPMVRRPFTVEGFDPDELVLSDGDTRAHLKIQDGCDFMCAFCIIPTTRGRSRPRTLDNLLAEGEALAAAGIREIVITGVNVGTYTEGGHDLIDVVDRLSDFPGLTRLRIGSIEPTTLPEALLERMADPAHALLPFLHLPLQSGSDRVLAVMRRRYKAAEYRAFAEAALARVPDLCLGADVLAGHPGEDDEAFGETLAFLQAIPFAYLHVFPFSTRPGTATHRMEGHLPDAVVKRRAASFRALSEEHRAAFGQRFLGRVLPVLFERPKGDGQAQGLTSNYIRVNVATDQPDGWRNRVLPVRLLEFGGNSVAGEVVEID